MASVMLGQVCLRYEWAPRRGRPVLLFSNSLGTDLRMWDGVVEALGEEFSVLRYDTRGHGESGIPQGMYSMDDLGRDVLGLLDHLGLERVHVCGLSLGGLTAQWLSVHAPQSVERMVLANTAAKIGVAAGWSERMAAVAEHGLAPLMETTMGRWFTPEFRESHREEVDRVRGMLAGCDREGYRGCCAAVRDADFRGELESIAAATLALYGTDDPVTTRADAEFLAEHIPQARVVGIEARHLSAVERPVEFGALLQEFLL